MEIRYRNRFIKEYKKLSTVIKDVAEKKEIILRKNPFDQRLKTHKLSGPLDGFLAFSVSQKYRIIFAFAQKDIVEFYSIGNHDIYD
ncbi:MAG: type II toxin-antitoxin system mRNA interferase toxin, RelE/StbE family [Patescibacteria group bacterium]|mgnify:FL=1